MMSTQLGRVLGAFCASSALAACGELQVSGNAGAGAPAAARTASAATPSGELSADPLVCVLRANNLCTSTISWSSSDADEVTVLVDGALFAAAQQGTSSAPWIGVTPLVFELWGDGVVLDSITVVGVAPAPRGTLTADPEVCILATPGELCSSTLRWSSTDAAEVHVTANGNLFLASAAGVAVAPWIGVSPVVFELWGDGRLLADLTVVGRVSGRSSPPRPPGTPVLIDPRDCRATDSASLRACHQAVLARQAPGIHIASDITCTGPRACHLNFDHFQGPVRIYGRGPDGGNVTIRRLDHFDYPIIEIVTSSGFTLRNLDFREGERNQPAGLYGTPGYDHNLSSPGLDHNLFGDSAWAHSTITVIFGSRDVVIDHIAVYESKQFGLEIGNCDDVTVRNSWFEHNWNNGIWVTNGLSDIVENDHAPWNLRIENNVFLDNRCVALGVTGQGGSWVSGNYLRHNHMGSLWHASGGQFSIEASTTSLTIADNEVTYGRPDEDPVLAAQGWKTVGIEFTDSHVHGVTLDHNYIHDNTGGGVIHDPLPTGARTDFGPIVAVDNVIDNPWIVFNLFDPGELIESGTCVGPTCVFVRARGELAPGPETCTTSPADGRCDLTVSWTSQATRRGVTLQLDGAVLGAGTAGSVVAALAPGHHRFDLYDGVTLLASRHVAALPLSP